MIPFNKACVLGTEVALLSEAMQAGQFAGDGEYTKKCHTWFKENLGFIYNLLTTSCSTSLDMSALLMDIKPGDEVIMPSFTFVSTANAFVLRGARIKFVDIRPDTMNMDENLIEAAITENTRAIVPVHYAGVACEMDTISAIAKNYKLFVVEDAAQGVHSRYKGKHLGSLSDFGCYSFHATKNYTSAGEGGLLILTNEEHFKKAEIFREKGTNRSQFLRGTVDKYTWVDLGSSLLPSDLSAAYLYAQLLGFDKINSERLRVWDRYKVGLAGLAQSERLVLPTVPSECEHNAHMFYIKLRSGEEAHQMIQHCKKNGVLAPFHYVPLHSSVAGLKYGEFVGTDRYTTLESSKLVRLPLYYSLTNDQVDKVIEVVHQFFQEPRA